MWGPRGALDLNLCRVEVAAQSFGYLSRLYFQSGFRGASGEYELPRSQVQILRSGTSGVEARADIDSWCIDFGF